MILKKELLRNTNNEPISPIASSQTIYRINNNVTVESSLNSIEEQIGIVKDELQNKADLDEDGRLREEQLPENIAIDFTESPINLQTEVTGRLSFENNTLQIINDISNLNEKTPIIEDSIIGLNTSVSMLNSDILTVELIAKGASRALVFLTESQLNSWIIGAYIRNDGKTTDDLRVGDNLLIIEREVPDYWWDGTQKQELETGKVDLSDYPSIEEVQNMIASASTELQYEIDNLENLFIDTNEGINSILDEINADVNVLNQAIFGVEDLQADVLARLGVTI